MPGSIPSMAVPKKQSVTPPSQGPLSTHTIESQRKGKRFERKGENVSKPESPTKRAICSFNKSAQIYDTLSPRAVTANGQNVDERLKAARERREENQKLLASREQSRLEREQRARRYYEKQLQERKKRLVEQRLKEERRRAAVEEKRKQRLREEKERCESAVRRTLEKSQKAQQTLSQITRGRKLNKNVLRRLPLTTWEKNLVSRLLTPTCSYLARSKSAGCQSGQEVSFHSMNTTTTTTHKPQHHSGSGQHRSTAYPSANNNRQRSINVPQMKVARQQETVKKTPSRSSNRLTSVQSVIKPSTLRQKNPSSPSPERTPRRSISRHPTPMQLELPSVPEEDAAVCTSALSPGNTRPVRKSIEGQRVNLRKENPPEMPRSNLPDRDKEAQARRTAGDGSPSKIVARLAPQAPEVMNRPSAGTTDPNEASRLLAERRREARLQREKEEQERLQREEAERRSREELEHRRAEERARQQAEERARQEAEAQCLIEEKRRREEEEQRRAEEERAQAMREAALLQKQREEELAREKAHAEHMQQQREKEEADRQARKKRLEEIMRRTRRTDSPDMKSVPVRILPNEAKPKENTEPVHNTKVEEAIKLPVGTKTTQLGLSNEEDMVPVVAFKERRSLRTLTGLEEIQTHQRAEVI